VADGFFTALGATFATFFPFDLAAGT
jgi:hypothetical protein